MWEILIKGGPLMVPIVFCSVLALAIVLERFYFLQKTRSDTKKFMKRITGILKRNRIMEAIDLCESTPGPVAYIVRAGILKHDRSRGEIREAVSDAGENEIPRLERNLGALATIAHVSPLLGLLGTVTGMVRAFQVIEQKASAFAPVNPGELAGGIWEALLTTVAGLCVAIPTYVAYNYLVSRVESIVLDMERSSTELVDLLSEKR